MIEHITTFVADALRLPLDKAYRGKPRFEALLSSYVKRCQALEDAVWEVILGRMFENAVGYQLDIIGKLVGQPRRGMEDDIYRIWITARIRINRSHGRPKDILEILHLVEPMIGRYREQYPCTAYYIFDEETDNDPNLLAELMREANAAGMMVRLVVPPPTYAIEGCVTGWHPALPVVTAHAFGYDGDPQYGGVMAVSYE